MGDEPKKVKLFSDDENDEVPEKKALFDDGEEEVPAALETINVDTKYASNLLRRKREEELRLMQKKFGDADDADDKSTDETSDEDGWMFSDKKKIELGNLIEAIRSGDTSKLKEEKFFYDSESGSSTDAGYVTDPQKQYKYTVRSQLWQALGDDDDLSKIDELAKTFEEQDDAQELRRRMAPESERQKNKEEFLALVQESEMGLNNWDVKEREQTAEDAAKQQVMDEKFWKTRAGKALKRDIERRALAKDKLETIFDASSGNPTDAFLRDYFVNEGWSWTKATEQPEVTQKSSKKPKSRSVYSEGQVAGGDVEKPGSSTEEEFTNNQEIFEHVYEEFKYRHQEEGFEEVAAPAYTGPGLRREESARKRRREMKAQREKEREQKFQEELARAKQLKKQELKAKAKILQDLSGTKKKRFPKETLQKLKDASLEDYDRIMADLFNDEYYDEPEDPDFDPAEDDWDEEEELKKLMGDDPSWQKRQLMESVFTDTPAPNTSSAASSSSAALPAPVASAAPAGSNTDSDSDSDNDMTSTQPRKRTVDKETVKRELEEQVQYTQKEIDEMGYEDIIAGGEIKCRFKYRNVDPIRFEGLNPVDILVLPDPTLDAIAPMHYLAPYRSKPELERDQRVVKQRIKRLGEVDYSAKVGSRKYPTASGIDPATWDEVKRKLEELKAQKAAKQKQKEGAGGSDEEAGYAGDEAMAEAHTKTKKKKKKHKDGHEEKPAKKAKTNENGS